MCVNKFFKTAGFLFGIFFLSVNLSVVQLYAGDKTEELAQSIDSILNYVNCKVSIQVTSADKYDLLYEHNPREKMIPASITKLVTASTAIDVLGINYDFKTVAYTDDNDLKDGVIRLQQLQAYFLIILFH